MRFAIESSQEKFVQFASNVMGLTKDPKISDDAFGLLGIAAFEKFLTAIEAPLKLSYYDIDDSKIDDMVSKTFGGLTTIGKLVTLNHHDVERILRSCL